MELNIAAQMKWLMLSLGKTSSDALKHQNYHMPRWIVVVTYVGTSCVALTFLISVLVLSPIVGYVNILFAGSNLFLHLICPVLAIILFVFVNTFHTLDFKKTFIDAAPIAIYAFVYVVMVFFVKKWDDYYCFNKFFLGHLLEQSFCQLPLVSAY